VAVAAAAEAVEAAAALALPGKAEADSAAADREGVARVLQGEIFALPVPAVGEPDRDFATGAGLMGAASMVGGVSVAGLLGRPGNSADETGITAGSSRLPGRYARVRRRTAASAALSSPM
jgi:hypothetical protein